MGRPSIPPPNLNGSIYSCIQEIIVENQKCQTSCYFQSSAPVAQANVLPDYNAIQSQWLTVFLPKLRACLGNTVTLQNFRIWSMNWPNIATGIFTMGGVAGTVVGDVLPPQVAAILSKATTLRGKSGRGRMYIPGIPVSFNVNGQPSVPAQAAYNALGTSLNTPWVDPGTAFTYKCAVVSLLQYRKVALQPNPAPPPPLIPANNPILNIGGMLTTTIICDEIFYTQQRRVIGRGQ